MAQAPHSPASRRAGLSYRDVGVASSEEMPSFGPAIKLLQSTARFARHGRPVDFCGVAEPYASVLEIGAGLGLAITTDGVGSKLLVAEELAAYRSVGIDCVAMNANDIVCVGAEPVAMVDYIAVKSTDSNQLLELAEGLVEGARQAHISIPGGETAQVAEMLAGGAEAFDLVGTCVGTVALEDVIMGKEVAPGDVLVGYASTGIHSNGLTLARSVFGQAEWSLGRQVPDFEQTLGEELLEPTAIYVDLAVALKKALHVRAFAHITSDGFINLTRVPVAVGFKITDLPPAPPPVFGVIQKLGEIPDEEMYRVFNMGVGFCAVVPEAEAGQALAIGKKCGVVGWRLGSVTTEHPGEVRIDAGGVRIHSVGKRFEPIP